MSWDVDIAEVRRAERERIANWMEARARLIMQYDRDGALELSVSASAIRADKLGPIGMHADEPIVTSGQLRKDLEP